MTEADARIVERCRRGDEHAWSQLFRLYAPSVARFLRATLAADDVDDLVQRVFLAFFAALPGFRGDASLLTYLYRVAQFQAQREVRTWLRRRRKAAAFAEHVALGAASGGDVDRSFEARERLRQLARAVAELDWKFRVVWVLRELEGLSVEEVALTLEERDATVRTRHHRARERIRKTLERQDARATRAAALPASKRLAASLARGLGDEQEVAP